METFEDKRQDFKARVNESIGSQGTVLQQIMIVRDTSQQKKPDEIQFDFDPNIAAKDIEREQLLDFAKFVRGTVYEKLIAWKDPKVQELKNYIIASIIFEYDRINGNNTIPIELHARDKSNYSFKDKIDRWSKRPEKQGLDVTDYIGFRILPHQEPFVLSANGDPTLQEMIDKREKVRKYLVREYKKLDENPNMTCKQYCNKCKKTILKLKDLFPENAIDRKEYYNKLINTINKNLKAYNNMVEDPNENRYFKEFAKIIGVDLVEQLSELEKHHSNEAILYTLTKNIMNVFEKSELLQALRYTYS